MIDKNKIYNLISLHEVYCSNGPEQPNVEEEFWIPMIEELSKDVDETIGLLEELEPKHFLYSLEVLDELIEKTQSHKLIDAVRRIGKEKGIDEMYYERPIKRASCWFDD